MGLGRACLYTTGVVFCCQILRSLGSFCSTAAPRHADWPTGPVLSRSVSVRPLTRAAELCEANLRQSARAPQRWLPA